MNLFRRKHRHDFTRWRLVLHKVPYVFKMRSFTAKGYQAMKGDQIIEEWQTRTCTACGFIQRKFICYRGLDDLIEPNKEIQELNALIEK
jgi:hypothetical protein